MRRRFGIDEGSLVIAEERDDGILIRPPVAVPVEISSSVCSDGEAWNWSTSM
jgi:bifunctional DNA-binding transcriptional regulator/antitoxin component of YhaV-PrlF toxin-antitoxin module